MIYQCLNLVAMRLIMADGFPPLGPDLSLSYGKWERTASYMEALWASVQKKVLVPNKYRSVWGCFPSDRAEESTDGCETTICVPGCGRTGNICSQPKSLIPKMKEKRGKQLSWKRSAVRICSVITVRQELIGLEFLNETLILNQTEVIFHLPVYFLLITHSVHEQWLK